MDITAKILLSAFGIVFGGLVGFWLGIVRERHNRTESKILEEKMQLLPSLERLIKGRNFSAIPSENLHSINGILLPNYERLKVIVTGRKLKTLTANWEAIFNIPMTETELAGFSKSHLVDTWTSEEIKRLTEIQDALISRLREFKKAVEKL
ncbi:MAG TPA: hypothetical protein VNV43_01995 [Candidatus Acidoferrales bacterium]|nr:hypothetical protein [Candidatus Acidoferrales bacterium]